MKGAALCPRASLPARAVSAHALSARVRLCSRLPARTGGLPAPAQRLRLRCSAGEDAPEDAARAPGSDDTAPAPVSGEEGDAGGPPRKRRTRKADSTDPVATFLTRRFGVAGGLAWLGVLSFGVISEQLKTRQEVAREESGTQAVDAKEVATPSGLRYTDLVRGGGETAPQRGYLLAAAVRVVLGEDPTGPVLFDTEDTGRPLAFFFGARPFQGALCAGVEEGIASMRAGGTRRLVVPAALGFPGGAKFPKGEVPAGSALTYTVKLLRVSVPPS